MRQNTIKIIEEFLAKARRRLSDEEPDYADLDEQEDAPDDYDSYDDEGGDDADRWLAENDPEAAGASEEEAPEAEPEAVSPPPKPVAKQPMVRRAGVAAAPAPVARQADPEDERSEDELQPTREELAQMREYTRPWEQRARDKAKLEAEAHKNPVTHHQGRLLEARNTAHADRQKAYSEFTNSPEFQNADPITQMEMEAQFHNDWHANNPEHLSNALLSQHTAHGKLGQAMQAYQQAKDEKIRHIAGGGVNPDAMSVEEGLQHVGGSREEDDMAPGGISQDRSAAFAAGNQDFINQYMQNYDKKAKKFSDVSEMDTLDPETRADVNTVLGDHPAFKDPAKKRQFDNFVAKYHPMIGKAARRVLSKLGLTDQAKSEQIDPGLLHEAGVHALFQAINDYNHDHPSKAKFTTHLNRKMQGLMHSALRAQDEIPTALRAGARRFDQQKRVENAAPVKYTNKEGVTTIINPSVPKRPAAEIATAHHPDIQDRLKRVAAAKAPLVRKQPAVQPKPVSAAPMRNINYVGPEEDE